MQYPRHLLSAQYVGVQREKYILGKLQEKSFFAQKWATKLGHEKGRLATAFCLLLYLFTAL